jgi:hypothetical protein
VTDQLTRESDNNTQAELAAWELLKEAREERDKAQALARELRDALVAHYEEYFGYSIRGDVHNRVVAALTKAKEVLP